MWRYEIHQVGFAFFALLTGALPVALGLAGCTRPVTAGGGTALKAAATGRERPPEADHVFQADLDLSIVYDPRVTGNYGWVKLPKQVPLHMIGIPGATIVDATARGLVFKPDSPYWQVWVQGTLRRAPLADSTVLLDEASACSTWLRDEVERAHPARLLLTFPLGMSTKAVSCLRALPDVPVYLTGCLHRPRGGLDPKAKERCDGDAELAALVADNVLPRRIAGLAVSLSSEVSVRRLGGLPRLDYLALSPGAGGEGVPLVDLLPFESLGRLRYLAAAAENERSRFLMPRGAVVLSRLSHLEWNGELSIPLPAPCRLRRLSQDSLSAADVTALGACTRLEELSSDSMGFRFEDAEPVARLTSLQRLHLRHFRAPDLTPLTRLRALRHLSLPSATATDFAFVGQLPDLRSLDLSQTSLGTLAPVAGLTEMEELDVGFTAVSDLTPLAGMSHLGVLALHQTKVTDLSVLAHLAALHKLSISSTAVTDLRPLANHPSVADVVLPGSAVTDVGPLLTLSKLKRAVLTGLHLPEEQVKALRERLKGDLYH